MFVAIVRFPSINPEQDTEFREWFSWSNQVLKNSPGFISRKLIKGKRPETSQLSSLTSISIRLPSLQLLSDLLSFGLSYLLRIEPYFLKMRRINL